MTSLALRNGADPRDVVNNIRGIMCPKPCFVGEQQILSCADAIGLKITETLDKLGYPSASD